MNNEIEMIIDKALEQEFNNGRMQGIHEFWLMLRDTHKTPDEIREYLNTHDAYSREWFND